MNPLDIAIMQAVQSWQPEWLTLLMREMSVAGSAARYLLLVPAVSLLFLIRGKRRLALAAVLVTAGNVLNPLLKLVVARPRPTADLVRVLGNGSGSSFPSGHALGAMVFFGFLAYVAWRSGRRALAMFPVLFILLVGYSRAYLGAHWPSDVLGGWLIGALWLAAFLRIAGKQRLIS